MSVSADRIRDWLVDQALPLWSGAGRDSEGGGFLESLGLDGQPLPDGFKRMRVQARQIYVYSHAHLLGWSPAGDQGAALAAARDGFEFLTRCYWRDPGDGFIFSTERDGTPADTRIETYEQAFALFAFAWYHRASGDTEALCWARRTLDFLDAAVADTEQGGYFENPTHDLPRRQNPHMHLLEALLAVHTATRDEAYLDRSRAIVELFRRRFFDADTGTLGEFFGPDWSTAPGTPGQTVEPGHHFEWVWLLRRYAGATGEDTSAEADALYRFAEEHGTDHNPGPAHGLAFDSVLRRGSDPRLGHGTSLDENKRLWVQTEAIKAQVARLEAGPDDHAAARLETLLDRLFTLYLGIGGGNWQDHLDVDGRGLSNKAPASSFYHLFLCLTEVLRVRDGIDHL
ncbi:MAG: mannose-6-phosphate isomerase [Alphaproteobacteria bacterium]|nr:mannose-6-phosphate isomerase [Alphaproteobacteria bacterium]